MSRSSEDRYAVILVDLETGVPFRRGPVYHGDEGAEDAALDANSIACCSTLYRAYVVGLKQESEIR